MWSHTEVSPPFPLPPPAPSPMIWASVAFLITNPTLFLCAVPVLTPPLFEHGARALTPRDPDRGTGLRVAVRTERLDLQKAGAPASPAAACGTCQSSPALEKIKPPRQRIEIEMIVGD